VYSHRYVLNLWKTEVLISSGVEVYFVVILCVLVFRISCGVYVFVCVLESVCVHYSCAPNGGCIFLPYRETNLIQ
jgi:hypothetical protein